MRLLLDYRPALKHRTGVGEWVHELARAMVGLRAEDDPVARGLELTLFSSSWRDRLNPAAMAELGQVRPVDCRIPVKALNRGWYRHGWPPVEWLAPGPFDIVHAAGPVLIPARRGLRVLTIFDLDFMHNPERAWGEMRTDYPRLARTDAARADLVIAGSRYSAQVAERELGVAPERTVVCRAGIPRWIQAAAPPSRAERGYILFVGTLEPRKNIGGLLDAYEQLLARWPEAPGLVFAGRLTESARPWLDRAKAAAFGGKVEFRGYIPDSERPATYRGAALLVLPSFDEGFGLPALEAMALGVPVVASNRGSLPEVIGNAGLLVSPDEPTAIADAMWRVLTQADIQRSLREQGLSRARQFSWRESASGLLGHYRDALARRIGGHSGWEHSR